MAITLGSVVFDERYTQVKEHHEEVGGRDEREIVLSGMIVNESTTGAIEAALDAILDASSTEDFSAALSVRAGRRLFTRRKEFFRELEPDKLVGSFRLVLEARDPFEESTAETQTNWTIAASGSTVAPVAGGNVNALAVVSLTASGVLVNPSVGDGVRTLSFSGTVPDAGVLVMDAERRLVTLDGVDVTPYTTGEFPLIDPAGTTLTYLDDAASSHTAAGLVRHRNRWW